MLSVISQRRLHVVELYAGTARSSRPFLGWRRCVLSLLVDNDGAAAETYRHNFPGAPYVLGDLARMRADRLLMLAGGRVDILLGCPPCQGFSDTGTRDSRDPRNSHMARFGRFAEAFRPLAIAMENVPQAAGTSQFRRFVRRMKRAGYAWTAGIVNAALRGSSQTRQRLVYIAIHGDVGAVPRIPPPTHGGSGEYFRYRFGCMKCIEGDRAGMLGEPVGTRRIRKMLPHQEDGLGALSIPCVGEVLEGLPAIRTPAAQRLSHRPWAHTLKQLRRMGNVPEGGRWHGGRDHFSQSYGRLHRRGLARTITTYFPNPGSGRFWHPTENRALTLREAARIQGFPDSFAFLPPFSRAAALVGNALDNSIATAVYEVIRTCLE